MLLASLVTYAVDSIQAPETPPRISQLAKRARELLRNRSILPRGPITKNVIT